jgi:hypothetical protein
MPAITIRDGLNAEIVSANPHVTTGLGKYLRGRPAALLAGVDVAGQLRTPLHLANAGESGLGLSWASEVALGESGTALTIEAGAMAAIGVLNRTGMEVFATTFVGEPITVPANRALVSFSFRPSLALDVTKRAGALTFGFDAGAAADISCFHPFDLTGPALSVGEACRTVLEHFVVPNDVDDLREMRDLPEGTMATVGGHGELRIAASVDVAAAFNPLASVDGIPVLGTLTVGGGASATVGVSATVSGDFQIRVEKTEGAVLRLSYHKVAGRELEVSLSATAGPAISLGNRELLGMLFNGPGGIPGASKEDLVQGGITSKQLDRVAAAMRAGLSRKIELAIAASFSSSTSNEAAFLYDIDLNALDDDGAKALDSALAGNLGLINALEDTEGAHGVRVLRSVTRSIRRKRIDWRINLVGLVNVLSMSELVRSGTVAHDEESGELLIVDKITSDRVGAITTNNKIRKLLYESTLMSLTYRAIGLDAATSLLDISQSFFYFDKSANRQRVSDYLDAVRALDLIDGDGDAGLGAEDDFGKASLLLETSFDDAASARLFVSPQGVPDREFYERIGREALLALVKPGEPDEYRRIPLRDDRLWQKMRDTGQPGFRFILPPPITGGSLEAIRVGVVESDYTLIVWWATAMAKAAERLAAMREFLVRQPGRRVAAHDPLPPELDQNPEFLALRRDLEKAMAKAIKNNKSTFDDPWGLIALHRASAGTATAAATLISPKLTLFLPE